MQFSLIVTTQGDRNLEFERLCHSLETQTHKDFELILLDQSGNDQLTELLEKSKFVYKIIKIDKVSLSKARNIGLENVNGEVICFPDDDCWYPENLLQEIDNLFEKIDYEVICCNARDPIKNVYLNRRQTTRESVIINTSNCFRYIKSITIFARKSAIKNMKYDERFGVGAKWGAGEETDLILQMLYNGNRIIYFSRYDIYHPYNDSVGTTNLKKVYSYGIGFGVLIAKSIKERRQYGVLHEYYIIVFRSIFAMFYYMLKRNYKFKIYINRLKGMHKGRKMYNI